MKRPSTSETNLPASVESADAAEGVFANAGEFAMTQGLIALALLTNVEEPPAEDNR